MNPKGAPGPDRWDTALYEDRHSFVWKQGASLVELLAPRPGERILDLGCGTGRLTAQLAGAGAEVVGIDSSPAMIEQARHAYPHLRFEVAGAEAFAFPEPFDGVFSNAALHWVSEPDRVIECVGRALRPGGRFVAEFGGRGNVQRMIAAFVRAGEAAGGGRWAHPWYFPSVGEYAARLERGGLEVGSAWLFDRPTPLEGEEGMRHWIAMFAPDLLERVPPSRREEFFQQVEKELRPALYRDGAWQADYRRLRVVARKEGSPAL